MELTDTLSRILIEYELYVASPLFLLFIEAGSQLAPAMLKQTFGLNKRTFVIAKCSVFPGASGIPNGSGHVTTGKEEKNKPFNVVGQYTKKATNE